MSKPSKEQIKIYKKMTPEQRLTIAMQWYDVSKEVLISGIIDQHPEYTPDQVHQEELRRLEYWYNRNY
ncbi:hypothetical protein ACFL4D_00075 [Candidatus Margulisiibacteriota bacterium]